MSNINWELKNCCDRDQKIFIATIGVFTVVILAVSIPFESLISYSVFFFSDACDVSEIDLSDYLCCF